MPATGITKFYPKVKMSSQIPENCTRLQLLPRKHMKSNGFVAHSGLADGFLRHIPKCYSNRATPNW